MDSIKGDGNVRFNMDSKDNYERFIDEVKKARQAWGLKSSKGWAIADYGLSVQKYFMIYAAVAMEAYQHSQNDLMRPNTWSGLDSKLWPTEWYSHFSPTDGRTTLTWRTRFSAFPNAYNCYSWGEEVLRDNRSGITPSGIPPKIVSIFGGGLRSWVIQEMTKGDDFLSGGGVGHFAQAGWAFGDNSEGGDSNMLSTADLNALSVEEIKESPIFREFNNNDIVDPVQGKFTASTPTGNGIVANPELLAEAIPAYSFAAGSNWMSVFSPPNAEDRNISMMSFRTDENEWPLDGITNGTRNWLHSDIRDVGYLHNFKLFDKFVEISELK